MNWTKAYKFFPFALQLKVRHENTSHIAFVTWIDLPVSRLRCICRPRPKPHPYSLMAMGMNKFPQNS
jgi:hypothetical protein